MESAHPGDQDCQWRRSVIGAALSAALLWAASPTVGHWWLAWIALVPAVSASLMLPGRAGRAAVPLALALYLETQLIPALPFGIAEGQWGDPPLPVMIGDSPVIAVALVAIPLYGLLLYTLPLSPRGDSPPGGDSPRLTTSVILPATTLAAVEFARANLDPGGLWGTLSLTQAGGEGARLAAIAGPWLLAFLIAATNYVVAHALVRRSLRLLGVPAVGLAIAFGFAALATPGKTGETIRVAAIQPGYDTAEEEPFVLRHWEPGSYELAALDVIGDLTPLTANAADAGAELVVWPEATTFADPFDESPVRRLAAAIATEQAVSIVYPHFDYEESRSAVSVVTPGLGVGPAVPKQRAMWFLGEEAGEADPEPLHADGIAVGTLLGVDAQDIDIAAELADRDAEVIASATHDWEQMATQQVAQARLTARATGLGIVRADWRYGSAIIAPDGELLADAGTGKRRTVLVADLPVAQATTYAAIGGVIGWLAVIATGALGLLSYLTGTRGGGGGGGGFQSSSAKALSS